MLKQYETHGTDSLTGSLQRAPRHHRDRGFSLIEILIVMTIILALTALSIPQMIAQRRLMRSVAVPREMATQLRYVRQTAMSQRRAYTFQYDDIAKAIKIIGPISPGPTALTSAAGYPNNAGSSVISIPLAQAGFDSGELSYGIPTTSTGLPSGSPALPTGALGDGLSKTDLFNSKLNITFQPDGSVIDSSGYPADQALFIFNKKAALGTATAISIMGTSGRVKLWRYNPYGNKYEE